MLEEIAQTILNVAGVIDALFFLCYGITRIIDLIREQINNGKK